MEGKWEYVEEIPFWCLDIGGGRDDDPLLRIWVEKVTPAKKKELGTRWTSYWSSTDWSKTDISLMNHVWLISFITVGPVGSQVTPFRTFLFDDKRDDARVARTCAVLMAEFLLEDWLKGLKDL